MPPQAPNELVEILRLAPGGEGVALRESGEVVFVPGSAPGDRLEIGEFSRTRGVLRARLVRVACPGPDRRTPPCPVAGDCGGCDFMHLNPEAQRREKLQMLKQALERVGGNPARPANVQFVSVPSVIGYRSRLRLHIDQEGRVGLLSPRSHRIVPVVQCPIADRAIDSLLARLAQTDSAGRRRLSFCEQIEIRSAPSTPKLAVRLFARGVTELRAELYASIFGEDALVVVAGSKEDHERTQDQVVSTSLSLRVPFSAFSQAHPEVNVLLVDAVVQAAATRNHRTFIDAYAGAGNFTLPLLQAGLTGEAVDTAGPGIYAARSLARELGLPFNGFSVGDARKTLEHFARLNKRFDYVVLDPPRNGAKLVLDAALRLRPQTIALVACDQVALARDLATLVGRGGQVHSLTIFDMFPETHHSEALAVIDFPAASSRQG